MKLVLYEFHSHYPCIVILTQCDPHQVGFDDTGKIWNMDMKFVCDAGCNASEATNFLTILGFQNTYKAEGWKAQKGHVHTNTAPNYFCRAPG